jgi:hypothetical protein
MEISGQYRSNFEATVSKKVKNCRPEVKVKTIELEAMQSNNVRITIFGVAEQSDWDNEPSSDESIPELSFILAPFHELSQKLLYENSVLITSSGA